MRSSIALVLPLSLALVLVPACGGDDGNGDGGGDEASAGPVGEWTLDMDALVPGITELIKGMVQKQHDDVVNFDDPQIKAALETQLANMKGMFAAADPTVCFEEDGTAYSEETKGGKKERKTGTWKLQGNRVVVTADDEADQADVPSFTWKDGKLTMRPPPQAGMNLVIPLKRR